MHPSDPPPPHHQASSRSHCFGVPLLPAFLFSQHAMDVVIDVDNETLIKDGQFYRVSCHLFPILKTSANSCRSVCCRFVPQAVNFVLPIVLTSKNSCDGSASRKLRRSLESEEWRLRVDFGVCRFTNTSLLSTWRCVSELDVFCWRESLTNVQDHMFLEIRTKVVCRAAAVHN